MKKIALLAFLMFGLGCASTPSEPIEPTKDLRFVIIHKQDIGGYLRIKVLLDTQTGDCYLATDGNYNPKLGRSPSTKSIIRISDRSCETR
ncbi:hypothetical protein LCGC14_1562320 [marine sediment metagenome]|uniref:Uncharacterized protein n=1 Tax=marine sediment metagenome TaxID=412755 RepID=A0A0F9IM20_9ZZZZ